MLEFINFDLPENENLDDSTLERKVSNALITALDLALPDLASTTAMVIDMRINEGGFDALGLLIAGRFFDKRRLVFNKKARKGDGYGNIVEIYQGPTVDSPYVNPIYLLTSDESFSAAETFIIAMRTLPHVTLVGEKTAGSISDILNVVLPNGWELGLSNEVYETAHNEVFESIGIPVELDATFLDSESIIQRKDLALEMVLNKQSEI